MAAPAEGERGSGSAAQRLACQAPLDFGTRAVRFADTTGPLFFDTNIRESIHVAKAGNQGTGGRYLLTRTIKLPCRPARTPKPADVPT